MYWNQQIYYIVTNLRMKEVIGITTSSDYAKNFIKDRGLDCMVTKYTLESMPEDIKNLVLFESEDYGDNPLEIIGFGTNMEFFTTVGEEEILIEHGTQIIYTLRDLMDKFIRSQKYFRKTEEEDAVNNKFIEDFNNFLDSSEDEVGNTDIEEVDTNNIINWGVVGRNLVEMGIIN